MSIRFQCSGCARKLKTKAESVGKVFRCSDCGETTRVPETSADVDSTRTYVPKPDEAFPELNDADRPKRRRSRGKKRNRRRGSTRPLNKPLIWGAIGGAGFLAAVVVVLLWPEARVNETNAPDPAETSRSEKPHIASKNEKMVKQEILSTPAPLWHSQIKERQSLPFGANPIMQFAQIANGSKTSVIFKRSTTGFAPNGHFAIVTAIKALQIFDLRNWRPVGKEKTERGAWLTHRDFILDASFSPDGEVLATANGHFHIEQGKPKSRGQIRLWNAKTGEPIGKPLEFKHRVRRVVFSPDGRLLVATAGEFMPLYKPGDKPKGAFGINYRGMTGVPTVHVLDAETLKRLYDPLHHLGEVQIVRFVFGGKTLMSAGAIDREIKFWNVKTGKVTKTLRATAGVICASMTPDGKHVVATSVDGQIHVWDFASGRIVANRAGEASENAIIGVRPSLSLLAISPNGKLIATTTPNDDYIRFSSLPDLRPVGKPLEHGKDVPFLRFSPDGRVLLSTDIDGHAQLWSAADGTKIGPPMKHTRAIASAEFSPDGRLIITAGSDATRIWRMPLEFVKKTK